MDEGRGVRLGPDEGRDPLRPSRPADKVVEDDKLRGFFVSECNDEEMYEAVRLLGGRLRKQLAWMAAEDCEDG